MQVLITARLPSLKVGTLFLGMMFFYDVFMVFISPLLFHGESVMMTVATAGEPTAAVEHDTGQSDCHRLQLIAIDCH